MSMSACHCCGIVTNDHEIAKEKMIQIAASDIASIQRLNLSSNDMYVLFSNKDYYKWIKPIDNARANRLHKAYFGKDITLNQYLFVQRQMCNLYCEEEEWI